METHRWVATGGEPQVCSAVPARALTHLGYFGRRPAQPVLPHVLLLDEDAGEVQGAQQRVGLEGQREALRGQQLQGVQGRVQVLTTAQLHPQVHQSLTAERGGGGGERERRGRRGREGVGD